MVISEIYNYEMLKNDICRLKDDFNFLELDYIGRSVLGRKIYLLKLGNGPIKISINATHHSLESITSLLLIKYIEELCQYLIDNELQKSHKAIFNPNIASLYFIPMVNPDGVQLVSENPIKYRNWQANVHGVDINHNYDAGFLQYKKIEKSIGVDDPGPTRYSGPYPESEPETKAMVDITSYYKFDRVLALHSQGEEIFYSYNGVVPPESLELAQRMAKVSGYELSEPSPVASYGGYKDWFIKKFNRPGYTIEVGQGKNPLPLSDVTNIYPDLSKLITEFIRV